MLLAGSFAHLYSCHAAPMAARQKIHLSHCAVLFGHLYPIKMAFSKLKAILRKAAARTVADLWDAIRDVLPRFTPMECANYFSTAGYEQE